MTNTNEVFFPTTNTWNRNDGRFQKDGAVYAVSDLVSEVKGYEQTPYHADFLNGNRVAGPVCPVFFHRVPRDGAVPLRYEMRVDGKPV